MSAFSKRFLIPTQRRLEQVLTVLGNLRIMEGVPLELILRTAREDKTDAQRALFHAVCDDFGNILGYFPGQMKEVIKRVYFGDDWEKHSTEDLDYDQYSALIECVYTIAADLGYFIPDRRRR